MVMGTGGNCTNRHCSAAPAVDAESASSIAIQPRPRAGMSGVYTAGRDSKIV
jgi:hypothetical protein